MPFDLAELEHDAPVLRELLHSHGWKVFRKHVEASLVSLQERLLNGSKEEFDYNKGVYWGALDTMRIPDTIMQLVEKAHANQ